MSTLENTVAEERLYEAFEIAMANDDELRHRLAHATLGAWDYYDYCFYYAREKLDIDSIWKSVIDQFYYCEGSCFDIRELCIDLYNIDFDDE